MCDLRPYLKEGIAWFEDLRLQLVLMTCRHFGSAWEFPCLLMAACLRAFVTMARRTVLQRPKAFYMPLDNGETVVLFDSCKYDLLCSVFSVALS